MPYFPIVINNIFLGVKQLNSLLIDERKKFIMQKELWTPNLDINRNTFYITKIELCKFINSIYCDSSITLKPYKSAKAFPYL